MDLWTEFDNSNQHPTAESAGHGRIRRPTDQTILSSLRQWLLQDYVAPYCRSLAAMHIYRRCYWIDGLGDGSPRTSAPILSPIVALSQELAQETRPIALHGIVLAANRYRYKEAQTKTSIKVSANKDGEPPAETSSNGTDSGATLVPTSAQKSCVLPTESGIVRASWEEIAPTLLNEIEQSPAIFLLSLFGSDNNLLTYDHLAPLYQRAAPSELCLLLSHKRLEAYLQKATTTEGSALSDLTALLRTDRWKSLLSTKAPIEGLIDLLIASLQRHFVSVQRIALLTQVRPAFVEAAPYTLLFATRRPDSLASINDAVCGYRRRLHEQSHRGVLGEEWFETREQERRTAQQEQIRQRILHLGQAQRPRRWSDLRQQLVATNFGHCTLQEYDEIIGMLIADGQVRCEWRPNLAVSQSQEDSSQGQSRSRIPSNEDTLLWDQKKVRLRREMKR